MKLQELIAWHLHNAKECENELDEFDQTLFHYQAYALLVQLEKEGKN